LKRRKFVLLSSLTGLGLFLATRYLPALSKTKRISEPLFRFIALGDVGMGDEGQYAVAEAMNNYQQKNSVNLILLAGDNIYPGGEIGKINLVFERPYQALRQQKIPFYAVLGNHDIQTNNGEDEVRYPEFNMQGRYYTFTKDIVQFWAIDTNDNANWSEQLAWLDKSLAKSQATWKIVFGHHPVYSSGLHGSTTRLQKYLLPLLSRHQVQLYLNGHDHNYERTKPIDGTTYLTCGGGANVRPVFRSEWTACSESILSFAVLEVYPQHITLEGIDNNGRAFDRTAILLNA
jgi:predicted phosphodiesterase